MNRGKIWWQSDLFIGTALFFIGILIIFSLKIYLYNKFHKVDKILNENKLIIDKNKIDNKLIIDKNNGLLKSPTNAGPIFAPISNSPRRISQSTVRRVINVFNSHMYGSYYWHSFDGNPIIRRNIIVPIRRRNLVIGRR